MTADGPADRLAAFATRWKHADECFGADIQIIAALCDVAKAAQARDSGATRRALTALHVALASAEPTPDHKERP